VHWIVCPVSPPEPSDQVEINEFRLFFVYIRQYYELWHMFKRIDASDDRRIDFAEFQKCLPALKTWGAHITDPEATWSEVDKNGGGIVLFDEFSAWALSKRLDMVSDDGFDDPALH
jgi:hypothetical protein